MKGSQVVLERGLGEGEKTGQKRPARRAIRDEQLKQTDWLVKERGRNTNIQLVVTSLTLFLFLCKPFVLDGPISRLQINPSFQELL